MIRLPLRRGTLGWMLAAYVSTVGLLAWLVPHRPRLAIHAGADSYLIGFSPDGSRVATASASPWRAWLDGRPNRITVWDVGGGRLVAAATRVADRSDERLGHLAWSWVDDPGRRWLFWQTVGADDFAARMHDLLPGVEVAAGDIDPTEDTPRVRVSADGAYVAVRTEHGAYRVSDRATGRTRATTGPTRVAPAFGPSPHEVTVVEQADPPGRLIVGRWDLTTGQGGPITEIDSVPGTPRLLAGGRWLAAIQSYHPGSGYSRLDLLDAQAGTCAVTDRQLFAWRFIVPGDRLVTIHNDGSMDRPRIMFRDMAGGAVTIRPPRENSAVLLQPATASPDGVTVALSDSRVAIGPWSWPKPAQRVYGWLRAVGGNETASLLLCNVESGEMLARLPANTDSENPLTGEGVAAFSDDGRQLAVLGTGGVVRVWDWPPGRPWALILALAAAPPAAVGSAVAGYRRFRGRRGGR